jgi:DNA primase
MSILDEVIEYLEYAYRYSNYIAAKCVFHDDSRPSLIIHEDYYNCLACDAKGRTEKLLDHLKGLPPKHPTSERFSNPFTKWMKTQTLSEALKVAWQTLNEHPSQYLTDERGITDDTRRKLKIGWRDGWYTFPIQDRCGKIVGAVARADKTNLSSAKYVTIANQDPNLLYVPSWEYIETQGMVYLVFGILDAVTLYQLGIASISTTGGKRLDPSALDGIRKRILFIPDFGEEDAAWNIVKHLGWRGKVAQCHYPEDSKDVNEMWVKHPEMLKSSIGV